jgi:hypothetical protein
MARTSYHDFMDAARTVFDLSYTEAQAFYRQTRDIVGDTPTLSDFMDLYAVEPEELEGPEFAYAVGESWDMDDFFDDITDWDLEVDEGFEFEITGSYGEDD